MEGHQLPYTKCQRLEPAPGVSLAPRPDGRRQRCQHAAEGHQPDAPKREEAIQVVLQAMLASDGGRVFSEA
jgi:hypothetical protein